jgi:hypothetical protein
VKMLAPTLKTLGALAQHLRSPSCLSTTARGNLLGTLKVKRPKRERCQELVKTLSFFLLLKAGCGLPTISQTPTVSGSGVDDFAGVLM